MNALTFNDVNFNPVQQNGQIWLTSIDIAKALGYKSTKSVSNLYNGNSDEFTTRMTTVIESMTVRKTGNVMMKTRIFSLRGCHLLAMFARTDTAKAFRVWVLDILDKETASTSIERTSLRQACDKLAVGNMLISDAYKIVTNRYNVERIDQIPVSLLPEAVAFAYEAILSRQKLTKRMDEDAARNNIMWRYVGIIKHHELSMALQDARDIMDGLQKAVNTIQGHSGLIFDAFGEQRQLLALDKVENESIYLQAINFVRDQAELTGRRASVADSTLSD